MIVKYTINDTSCMFAEACERMMKCTRPVIVSQICVDGSFSSSIGSFVVINQDGWVLTAAHLIASFRQHQIDKKKMDEVDKFNREHPESPKMYDPKWVKGQSFWWSWDNVGFKSMFVIPEMDLALIQLTNFRSEYVAEYPVFKDPEKMKVGMSLCRLGFPFVNALTSFNESINKFTINPGVLPVTFFPNDGILTRHINAGKSSNREFDISFIETSSPGLKGQSGGPVFDKNGYIMGIQSKTVHHDLGFDIHDSQTGLPIKQFLNVGVGVHVSSIIQVLNNQGIKYKSECDDDGFRIMDW